MRRALIFLEAWVALSTTVCLHACDPPSHVCKLVCCCTTHVLAVVPRAMLLPQMVPFFFTTWEHYYTNELILPIINGPSEGVRGRGDRQPGHRQHMMLTLEGTRCSWTRLPISCVAATTILLILCAMEPVFFVDLFFEPS